MESLQLFTMLLLAVAITHLLFSAAEVIGRWTKKDVRTPGLVARGNASVDRSGWYVFFDPADLYGRKSQPGKNSQRKNDASWTGQSTRPQKPAARRPRASA